MTVANVGGLQVGTVSGWLTLLALVAVGYYVVRGQGGAALTILQEANKVLRARIVELTDQVASDAKRIAELEATRSLAVIGEQITAAFDAQRTRADTRLEAVLAWAQQHEQHAQERHDEQLAATRMVGTATVEALHAVAGNGDQHEPK